MQISDCRLPIEEGQERTENREQEQERIMDGMSGNLKAMRWLIGELESVEGSMEYYEQYALDEKRSDDHRASSAKQAGILREKHRKIVTAAEAMLRQ